MRAMVYNALMASQELNQSENFLITECVHKNELPLEDAKFFWRLEPTQHLVEETLEVADQRLVSVLR